MKRQRRGLEKDVKSRDELISNFHEDLNKLKHAHSVHSEIQQTGRSIAFHLLTVVFRDRKIEEGS